MSSHPAISFFEPSGSDWVVTLFTMDGRTVKRRFCPGTIDPREAMDMTLRMAGLSEADCADISCRRADDVKVDSSAATVDLFDRLMKRVGRIA